MFFKQIDFPAKRSTFACHTYLESLCISSQFGLSGNHFSASYEASEFCLQIALNSLQHLRRYHKKLKTQEMCTFFLNIFFMSHSTCVLISLFLIQSMDDIRLRNWPEEWRQYCWYYPQYSGYMLMLPLLIYSIWGWYCVSAFSLILTLMDEGAIFDVFLLTFIRSL